MHIYCINLESRPDRKARMEQRFTARGMLSDITFVPAVRKDDPLIAFYDSVTSESKTDIHGGCSAKATVACFASHIKALQMIAKNDKNGAIVCEDDVLPHNNFLSLFEKCIDNLPEDAPLCMLSYFPCDTSQYTWSGKDPNRKDICRMGIDNVWGTQMYWISQEYARNCVEKYHRPGFGIVNEMKTSEHIPRKSNGYLCVPILAIEDCIDSDIRDFDNTISHLVTFGKWDYSDFSLGDRDSPLQRPEIIRCFKNCSSIINKLRECRNSNKHAEGLSVGKATLPYLESKHIPCTLDELSAFLDEYYISAFYSDRTLALSIAKYYAKKVSDDSAFKEVSLKNEKHIRQNFSYVGVDVFTDM